MISSDKCGDLTVLIVNYNSDGDLSRCLSCVASQTVRPIRVVIVDNASTDTSILQAKSRFPEYEFIELDSNLGFAAANNLILKTLKTDYVALLNPDAFADPEWLENLLSAALRYSDFDSFASCQLMGLDEFRLDGAGDVYKIYGLYKRRYYGRHRQVLDSRPDFEEVFSACAGAALYRTAAVKEVDGFDESFFCYGEDVDLGFRMRLRGGKCLFVKEAVVRHIGSAVTGKNSDFSVYYGHRNAEWVWLKNTPLPLLLISLPLHLGLLVLVLLYFSMSGRFKTIWRAKIDAYLAILPVWRSRMAVQNSRIVRSVELLRSFSR